MKINDSLAIIMVLFTTLFTGYCYVQYKGAQLSEENALKIVPNDGFKQQYPATFKDTVKHTE